MPPLPLARQPANQQHDAATAEVDVVWPSPTAAGLVRRNTDLVAVRFPHELDRFHLDEAVERPGTCEVRIRGGPKTDREGMVVGW